MKINFWMLVLLTAFSCTDGGGHENTYNFKDQHLAGKIGNQSWRYSDGYVVQKDGELWITLLLDHGDNTGCDIVAISGNRIWSSVPDDIGLYELRNFTDNSLSRNVVIVDDAKKEERSAQRGAIEILKITETEVTGRIDAEVDGHNLVNGSFALPLCNE